MTHNFVRNSAPGGVAPKVHVHRDCRLRYVYGRSARSVCSAGTVYVLSNAMELRRRKNQRAHDAGGGTSTVVAAAGRHDEVAHNTPHISTRGSTADDGRSFGVGGSAHNNANATSHPSSEDAVVAAAVRGGSLLMLLALVQRSSTFVLNILLQRAMLSENSHGNNDGADDGIGQATSALEEYGAAAITLELISSTALFLSREPLRIALARSCAPLDTGGEGSAEQSAVGLVGRSRARREAFRRRFVNTAWLSAPIGVIFSAVVWAMYPWVIRNDAFADVKENRQAATLVCFAAAVELMCEPLALVFQHQLLVSVRVRAEAAAVLVLGVSRYILVAWAGMGVLSFGYAQLLHSGTLAIVYLLSAASQIARTSRVGTTARVLTHEESGKNRLPGEDGELVVGGRHGGQTKEIAETRTGDLGFAELCGWLPGPPRPYSYSVTPQAIGVSINTNCGNVVEEDGERQKGGVDDENNWVDYGQLKVAGALAGQSVVKHVLTEGDKIVLASASTSFSARTCSSGSSSSSTDGGLALAIDGIGMYGEGIGGERRGSLYEQGVYAVASGYGSLAARLLFQPLEEAARLMFSQLGAEEDELRNQKERLRQQLEAGNKEAKETAGDKVGTSDMARSSRRAVVSPERVGSRNKAGLSHDNEEQVEGHDAVIICLPGERQDLPTSAQRDDLEDGGRRLRSRMADLLATLLKVVLTAGLVFVCFGFHYTQTLLRLLLVGRGNDGGDNTLSEVASVLSWYCVYVLFLAANGMCEAFACAVARGSQLTGMGVGLVASFAAFWALVGPLTGRFGTRGLVMANSAGMACRVVWSAAFIRRFFLQQDSTTTITASRPTVERDHQLTRGEGKKRCHKQENLWRRVVAGALPHPIVITAMIVSSVVVRATSPYYYDGMSSGGGAGWSEGGHDWNILAAARHVAIGAFCLCITALVFAKCERKFLGEWRALWAARRPRSAA